MDIKRTSQKGVAHLALIAIVVAAIGVTVYLATQTQVFRGSDASEFPAEEAVTFPAGEVTTEVPAIENEADLKNTLEELENTNLDQVNEMIFENEEDAQSL